MSEPIHACYDFFRSCLSFQKHAKLNVFNRFDPTTCCIEHYILTSEIYEPFQTIWFFTAIWSEDKFQKQLKWDGNFLYVLYSFQVAIPWKPLQKICRLLWEMQLGVLLLYTKSAFPCPFWKNDSWSLKRFFKQSLSSRLISPLVRMFFSFCRLWSLC